MTTCDVLFFGAHPDDIELGCGGTVAKLTSAGYKVGMIDLTRGELGTRGTREIRDQEAKEATRILGASVRDNCEITDGHIEINRENKAKVITMIRKYRPELVILPYFSDRHPDHVNASKLVKECIYYSGTEKWPTGVSISELPPHRPKFYLYFMLAEPFQPTLIVDVTTHYQQRMDAFHAYKSQFFVPGQMVEEKETWISTPAFSESLIARLRFYGFQIGATYGEGFYADQPLPFGNLMSLLGK